MRIPLTRYGLRELLLCGVVLAALCAAAVVFFWYVTPIFLAPLVFLLMFFRDPSREVPAGERLLVAPADGRVTAVDEVEEETLGGRAARVSIFLSIFDVHINRAPCSGRVMSMSYQPGEFHDARSADASQVNESHVILVESDEAKGLTVLVKQVAGLIARRIVCDCAPGRTLARGERFGMIKFGSRTDVEVPAGRLTDIRVKVGDRVKAGVTVIGVLR